MSKSYSPSKEAKQVTERIISHCKNLKLEIDKKGYLKKSITDNLINNFDNWTEIKSELESGQGSELIEKNGTVKFKAVHSSSALCVNNFAPFKQYLDRFNFLGYSNFTEATFEKKVPTGISFPNLDFYLENEKTIIGFESKYTEFLKGKLPNKNLKKYINRKKSIKITNDSFFSLIEEYDIKTNHYHLDIAQLLKHAIGLLSKKSKTEKKVILVYIYWLPENWKDFEVFKKHQAEIEEFKSKIVKYIEFIPISYLEFWKMYETNSLFCNHIKEVKARYNLSI